jgi:hypothetical protein
LTETSPVLAVTRPENPHIGFVGPPLDNVELRIGDQGEILARGPSIMQGYFNNPAATAEALAGGWFHTGDVGEIDTDGALRITDRLKDLIVTAGGKKVAPQPIEARLKAFQHLAEAVLIGDHRNYIAALVVPNFHNLEHHARHHGIAFTSHADLVESPAVLRLFADFVAQINQELAPFERIKRFRLLERELAATSGELTPSMKVKRGVVMCKWIVVHVSRRTDSLNPPRNTAMGKILVAFALMLLSLTSVSFAANLAVDTAFDVAYNNPADTPSGNSWVTGDNGGWLPSTNTNLGLRAGKGSAYEGGVRVPLIVRWPGVIRPGTVKTEMFASLDWLPTLVEIAGGPRGDGLKQRIEAGQYPGIVRTTLDGKNQVEYLSGRSEKSARDTFFYYSSAHPSAVRYKNWKMYFAIAPETATGFLSPGVQTQFAAGMVNLKRDPFEMSWGDEKKAAFWFSGALAGPVTAYIYDWNLLPIGQMLWLKELETYKAFPPLQSPASYNLDQVMEQLKNARTHPSQ